MRLLQKFRQASPQMQPATAPSAPTRGKRGKDGSTARERWASRAYLAPSMIGVGVFFLAPFVLVIVYAMVDNPISMEFVGLQNFKNVLQNNAFKDAAGNTLRFSLFAVPLAVVLSLLLAMLLEAKIPGKSRFRTFFLSPMMVPVASVVLIWQVIFHNNGALNNLLSTNIDWMQSDYSQIVILLLFLWKNLGYNMILFMAALSNIPKEQIEAASVDGAGALRRFWIIKFRYLSPSILFVTILSLINSFKIFREVYLLAGDYPYKGLYLLQHFMNNTFRSFDYQKLSAAAIIMAFVMVIIIGALFIAEYLFGKDVEQ